MQQPCIDHGFAGDRAGYSQTKVNGKWALRHRLVFAAYYGHDEATMGGVVMHSCDNPRCINPLHLSLGTHAENAKDRDNKGRANTLRGEAHGNAKLSDEQIRAIKARYVPRDKVNGSHALAREFGIAQSQVSRYVREERRVC